MSSSIRCACAAQVSFFSETTEHGACSQWSVEVKSQVAGDDFLVRPKHATVGMVATLRSRKISALGRSITLKEVEALAPILNGYKVNVQTNACSYRDQLANHLRRICDFGGVELASDCRTIADGDEHFLRLSELLAFRHAVPTVKRASGAARAIARLLLIRLGSTDVDLPRAPGCGPRWPLGFVGSVAHDQLFAVAIV